MSSRPPRSGNPEDSEHVLLEILARSTGMEDDDEGDCDWKLPMRWLELVHEVAFATSHRA